MGKVLDPVTVTTLIRTLGSPVRTRLGSRITPPIGHPSL